MGENKRKASDKPGSVVGNNLSRRAVTDTLERDTQTMQGFYLVPLAADRVYLAGDVTTPTGGLLPHPFTLTRVLERVSQGSDLK